MNRIVVTPSEGKTLLIKINVMKQLGSDDIMLPGFLNIEAEVMNN